MVLMLQMCRKFERGECNLRDCRFAHVDDPVNVRKHRGKVPLCADFLKGKCDRVECKYFHPPACWNIDPNTKDKTVPVCSDYLNNNCFKDQEECDGAHPENHNTLAELHVEVCAEWIRNPMEDADKSGVHCSEGMDCNKYHPSLSHPMFEILKKQLLGKDYVPPPGMKNVPGMMMDSVDDMSENRNQNRMTNTSKTGGAAERNNLQRLPPRGCAPGGNNRGNDNNNRGGARGGRGGNAIKSNNTQNPFEDNYMHMGDEDDSPVCEDANNRLFPTFNSASRNNSMNSQFGDEDDYEDSRSNNNMGGGGPRGGRGGGPTQRGGGPRGGNNMNGRSMSNNTSRQLSGRDRERSRDRNGVEICGEFKADRCMRGANCKFSHDLSGSLEANNGGGRQMNDGGRRSRGRGGRGGDYDNRNSNMGGNRNPTSLEICNDFLNNRCDRGSRCKFSHDTSLLLRDGNTGDVYSGPTELCADWRLGKCARFDCRFLHMIREEAENAGYVFEGTSNRIRGRRAAAGQTRQRRGGGGAGGPQMRKELCGDFQLGKCLRPDCRFVHEFRAPDRSNDPGNARNVRTSNRERSPRRGGGGKGGGGNQNNFTGGAGGPPPPSQQNFMGGGGGRQMNMGGFDDYSGGGGNNDFVPCMDFRAGRCFRGDNCKFFHEPGYGGN
ncbi:unnamed protein product [Amoebophrya sp. A120]|nr:unnamed protein product [Amoebophrya sp. A120]|eukprot:GSA120T00015549001.1